MDCKITTRNIIAKSVMLPRVTPDITPTGMLINSTITAEISDTHSVAGRRWAMIVAQGWLYWVEWPRSPISSPFIYRRYWMI